MRICPIRLARLPRTVCRKCGATAGRNGESKRVAGLGTQLGRKLRLPRCFFCFMVPGATRPQSLPWNWLDPAREWVIGFSFQLAINQHQFALHALGYCHLCKNEWTCRFLLLKAIPGQHNVMAALGALWRRGDRIPHRSLHPR